MKTKLYIGIGASLLIFLPILFGVYSINDLLNIAILIVIFAILFILAIIGYFSAKKTMGGEAPKTWWQKRHASTTAIIASVCLIFIWFLIFMPNWFISTMQTKYFGMLILCLLGFYLFFPMKDTKPITLFRIIAAALTIASIVFVVLKPDWDIKNSDPSQTTQQEVVKEKDVGTIVVGKTPVKLPELTRRNMRYYFTVDDSTVQLIWTYEGDEGRIELTRHPNYDGTFWFGYREEINNPDDVPAYIQANKNKVDVKVKITYSS